MRVVYRIDEYIPDPLYDSWETVRDTAIDWMIKLGIIGRASKSATGAGPEAPRKSSQRFSCFSAVV
jgi:protein kinase C substrate 80K-H